MRERVASRASDPFRAPSLLGAAVLLGLMFVIIGGVLSLYELASVAAMAADALPEAAPSKQEALKGGPGHASAKSGERKTGSESEEEPPPKVRRYAERLVRQYDLNGDGKLQPSEWRAMAGKPESADVDRDEGITADELARWVYDYGKRRRIHLAYPIIGWSKSEYQKGKQAAEPNTGEQANGESPVSPEGKESLRGAAAEQTAEAEAQRREGRFYVPAKRLPAGLPSWFLLRDADGDGQLTQAEFAPKATPADLEEFGKYDLNGDGVITPKECVRALKTAKPTRRK